MRNSKLLKIGFVLVFISAFLPSFVRAAGIYFSPIEEKIYQGDTFLVKLRISSPDKNINVLKGDLIFDKNKLEVKEISTGGSIFDIWAKEPSFSNKEGKINFVGGNPNGFQGDNGLVLKIFFLAKDVGKAKLDFEDGTLMFLNNGKGTPIGPWLRPLVLNISERPTEATPKSEWQRVLEKDKTPPEPFEIKLSRDPSIFDDKYFISFFTTDKETGIAYYEVKEGDNPWQKTGSPYLLKDQLLKSIIKVKVVDKAGNERIEELMPPKKPFYKNILSWIVVIIVIIIVYVLWGYFKRRTET